MTAENAALTAYLPDYNDMLKEIGGFVVGGRKRSGAIG